MRRTGGCQCGAVRFAVEGELGRASICHCRMCQKAYGAPYGALVSVRHEDLTWTRGEPRRFESSNKVARGFCPECGTTLTFEYGRQWIDLSICAFDEASGIVPEIQLATESRIPWVDHTAALPVRSDEESAAMQPFFAGLVSHQHPDHDTQVWPQEPGPR